MNTTSEKEFNPFLMLLTTSCFLGLTLAILGVILGCINYFPIFNPEQVVVLDKVKIGIERANTSGSATIAEQQLTGAIAELDKFLKMHPLTRTYNEERNSFQIWYGQLLAVKQRIALASVTEKSLASPLEKLQAQDIAMRSLHRFTGVEPANRFGADEGTNYKIPNFIPIQLNAREETIAESGIYLFLGGIAIASPGFLVLVIACTSRYGYYD